MALRNPSKHELCFALRDECDPRWYLFRATAPTGVKAPAQLKAKRADVGVSASWGRMHYLATLKYGCCHCVETVPRLLVSALLYYPRSMDLDSPPGSC